MPKISEEEALEAIKWEVEASIPMSADQVYFDWQFLDQEENSQNVLTVAVSKEIIDDLVEILEACGLFVFGGQWGSTSRWPFRRRQVAGGCPNSRRKARLNAVSVW